MVSSPADQPETVFISAPDKLVMFDTSKKYMHVSNRNITVEITAIKSSVPYLIDESTHSQAGRDHEQSVMEEKEVAFI